MSTLSLISKKIIQSRLYDKGIIIDISNLDNYIINTDSFKDYNTMHNFIIDNYSKLVID